MNGDRKKTPTQFKKGCTPWNKGVSLPSAQPTDESGPPESSRTLRMNKEEYYLVTQTSRDGTSRAKPDCEGKSGSARLLRPIMPSTSDQKKEQVSKDTERMSLVGDTKMVEAWNTGYELHRRDAPQCDVPQMEFLLCISLAESSRLPRGCCRNRCLSDRDCEDPEFSVCRPRIWCQWWFCGRTCQIPPDSPPPDNPCCPNPCANGGTCFFEGARFKCDCPPEYTGDLCEEDNPCFPNPCANGGTCLFERAWFKCDCPPEYTGDLCEEELPDPCDANPCVNGDCTRTGAVEFQCSCNDGWRGDLCDTSFLCGDEDYTCVPFSTICNRTSECPNEFDEAQCCGDSTIDFQCGAPTYCIPPFNACDGEEDCVGTDIDETFYCSICTVTAEPDGGPD